MIKLIIPRKIYRYSSYQKKIISQESRVFFAPNGYFVILFYSLFNSYKTYTLVKEAVKRNIGVVYVSRDLPEEMIKSPNVVYVKSTEGWFNPLLVDKTPIKALYADNWLVKRADYFREIPKIESVEDLDALKSDFKKGKNNILIDIDGGMGDNLLTIPTVKTLSKHHNVLVKTKYPSIFDNLDYVKIYNGEPYRESYYLNFGRFFSDYTMDINKQNRIFAIANFCGLFKEELVINKPEIVLSEEEKNMFEEYDTFLGITSNRPLANLPLDIAQQIINKNDKKFVTATLYPLGIKGITVYNNLTIRQLFALMYKCSNYVGIDTFYLHIAGALGKKITLFPNLIPAEWRVSTYDNVNILRPNCSCYPCVNKKFVEPEKRLCNGSMRLECFYKIDYSKIYEG